MAILSSLLKRNDNELLSLSRYVLSYFKVQHTSYNVKSLLTSHIEMPSLLTIKDTLTEYGIESAAIQKGNYSYVDFQTPFICAIQKEGWPKAEFTVVTSCENDKVTYLDPTSSRIKDCSLEEFEKMDKEVVLLLDDSHKKDELNYETNKQKQKTDSILSKVPVYAFSSILLLSLAFLLTSNSGVLWYSLSFLITSTVGLLISILLVWHEVDAHNPFLKEVCGGGSRSKLNCNAVLSSTGSHFLGISWSVWGFSYFTTLFISAVFFSNQIIYLWLWSALSVSALLYVPYSIYYQAIVKQWCPLCLAVQGLIVINGIVAIVFLYQTPTPFSSIIQPVFNLIFLGLTALLATFYAIPLLKKAREAGNYEKRWKNLRFNPQIFQAILDKSEGVNFPAEDIGIVVGNPNAGNEIIKVCNPYCGPCSKAHPELEHIIRSNPDVKVRIIFTASGEDSDIKTAPVAHLLAVQQKHGNEKAHEALDDWYLAAIKDYDAFALKYPMNGELKEQKDKIVAMRDWCDNMKIRATPTLFINGRELPDTYHVGELKNFF